MRIISKIKDYYDYLVGRWGEDEKLFFDRTKAFIPELELRGLSAHIITVHFCDFEYSGVVKDQRIYWNEEIEEIAHIRRFDTFGYGEDKKKSDDYYHVNIKDGNSSCDFHLSKKPIPSDLNEKIKCPIILKKSGYSRWKMLNDEEAELLPILKHLEFNRVKKPEDAWIELSNWFSKPVDIVSNQTDKEKIISAGFDVKTSFRKM